MPTLAEELTALKTEEDKITGNKVANFSYDDYAYTNNDANGVDSYNVDAHQNIPNGTASILKVNPTILTKGWRAQASAITRMLMNHFLGRCSYNLNKINDHFSTLLTKLMTYLGSANGIATLDANGYVPTEQLDPTGVVKTVNSHTPSDGNIDVSKSDVGLGNVVNTGDSATPVSGGTTKFTTGGAYTELAKRAPTKHTSSDRTYGEATMDLFGHVRKHKRTITSADVVATTGINLVGNAIHIAWNNSNSARDFGITNSETYGKFAKVITFPDSGNVTSAYYNVHNGTPVTISVPANSTCLILSLDFYTCHLVE